MARAQTMGWALLHVEWMSIMLGVSLWGTGRGGGLVWFRELITMMSPMLMS